eukprot:2737872-Rhodomonas_salina.1
MGRDLRLMAGQTRDQGVLLASGQGGQIAGATVETRNKKTQITGHATDPVRRTDAPAPSSVAVPPTRASTGTLTGTEWTGQQLSSAPIPPLLPLGGVQAAVTYAPAPPPRAASRADGRHADLDSPRGSRSGRARDACSHGHGAAGESHGHRNAWGGGSTSTLPAGRRGR